MSDFTANVRAILDTSDITAKLSKVQNTPITLSNVNIDTAALIKAVQNALNSANFNLNINTTNIQQQGANAGKQFANALRSGINTDVLTPATRSVQEFEKVLSGKGMDATAIQRILDGIIASAQKAEIQITSVSTAFKNAGKNAGNISKVTTMGYDKNNNPVTITDAFDGKTGQLLASETKVVQNFAQEVSKAAQSARQSLENTLNVKLGNGEFKAEMNSIVSDIEKLKTTSMSLSGDFTKLESAFNVFGDSNNSMDDRIAALKSYMDLIPGVRAQIQQLAEEEKRAAAAVKLSDSKSVFGKQVETAIKNLTPETQQFKQNLEEIQRKIDSADKSSLSHLQAEFKETAAAIQQVNKEQDILSKSTVQSNKMQTWLNKNLLVDPSSRSRVEQLIQSLNGNVDADVLKRVTNEFREIDSAAAAAGQKTDSFGASLKSLAMQVTGITSAAVAIDKVISAIKQGVNTVVELDTALVDLQKTTTASASELNDYYFEANDIAKQYGATTKEIISSAADWSRLGFSLNDSKTMAKYSSMFKSISPGMDIDTATTSLVSTMKAYGVEADDVLDGVISKINIIGNTAATSNDQIANGLRLSSSAMAAMGSSLEENIALFTAAQEIIQDDSKVGNALRTISMRVRGYDEETEELSDDLVNIKGEVVDLTKTAKNPEGVSLFTDETQTQYKSIYQYLEEISEIYDELGEKQRQELMEKLFGKNRAEMMPVHTVMCAKNTSNCR